MADRRVNRSKVGVLKSGYWVDETWDKVFKSNSFLSGFNAESSLCWSKKYLSIPQFCPFLDSSGKYCESIERSKFSGRFSFIIIEVEKPQFFFYFSAVFIDLYSSEPQGMAYIETSNLDGETNLKIRQVNFFVDFFLDKYIFETFLGFARNGCDVKSRRFVFFHW